ncbi:MAG: hypothetical protein LKF87_13010 [Clostridium tyrobutyricum]|uniref:hypothetical protein n=1 Tax=Clostridium tyrobutyricum TaxID=1519 RepID=UPI00073DAD24|nr:hypothetical protein [Clostridium tyrobutyricum]MBR9648961.1 hypothetical protein [Clostridium tyrobutyricum]MCH4199407.1 hypothetical protein [Clostridium tyrobutyricum]MCH4237823.1 hypothetical protein [Clostridium tyrobutyricum]MCH4259839.1 hypothetical protein [Clostridium tyrobutyricum]MCI1240273.1 hypothetical protein [Clostridium tyrobutyricum]
MRIKNIDSVIYRYFKQYCNKNKLDLTIESRNPIIENIITRSIVEVGKLYSDIKIISQENLNFIKEEIFWIKSCNYLEVEEYQNADRVGRMSSRSSDSMNKLHKNSRTRSAIFNGETLYYM